MTAKHVSLKNTKLKLFCANIYQTKFDIKLSPLALSYSSECFPARAVFRPHYLSIV
jgi:hypothetical protein